MAVVDLRTSSSSPTPWQQALYGEIENPWYRGERAWMRGFATLVVREIEHQHLAFLAQSNRQPPETTRTGRPKRSGTMNDSEFMCQLARGIVSAYDDGLTLDNVARAIAAFGKRQLQRRMRECGLEWHPFQAIAEEFVPR